MQRYGLFVVLILVIGINGFYATAYGGLFEEKYFFDSTWGAAGSVEGALTVPMG